MEWLQAAAAAQQQLRLAMADAASLSEEQLALLSLDEAGAALKLAFLAGAGSRAASNAKEKDGAKKDKKAAKETRIAAAMSKVKQYLAADCTDGAFDVLRTNGHINVMIPGLLQAQNC